MQKNLPEQMRNLMRWAHLQFTRHPEETGETYFEHMGFTLVMGMRFIFIGVVILVHGILPFTFIRTASNQVMQVYRIMRMRVPKAQKEKMEQQEHEYHGA